jgi:hypothetical protein
MPGSSHGAGSMPLMVAIHNAIMEVRGGDVVRGGAPRFLVSPITGKNGGENWKNFMCFMHQLRFRSHRHVKRDGNTQHGRQLGRQPGVQTHRIMRVHPLLARSIEIVTLRSAATTGCVGTEQRGSERTGKDGQGTAETTCSRVFVSDSYQTPTHIHILGHAMGMPHMSLPYAQRSWKIVPTLYNATHRPIPQTSWEDQQQQQQQQQQ